MNGRGMRIGGWGERWPTPVVALVALAAAWPHWWPGRVVVSFDGATYSGPNTRVTAEALTSWRIPFLNPWIFGGAPHLGNHQTLVLYPPRWLVLPFDAMTANGLLVAAHLVLLGVATLWLMRRLSVGPIGATTAGIIAVLSGSATATSVQFEQILVLAWAPLLLWAIAGVTESGAGSRRTAGLALVVALTIVSGHPQMVLEVGVLATVFAVALVTSQAGRAGWRRLAVGAIVGLGMAGAQLAATAAATAGGALDRGRSLEDLSGGWFVLRGRSAAAAVFGTILGRSPDAFSGSFESILWVGVVAVVLALIGAVVGLADARHRAWTLGVTVTAFVAGVWALGPRTSLWRLAAEWLPVFSSVRVSARWLDIVGIVVAMLAGLGIDALARRPLRMPLMVVIPAIAVTALAVGIGPLESGGVAVAVVWAITAVAVVVAAIAVPARRRQVVVVALVVVELALMARTAIPYRLVQDHPPTADPSSVVLELAERASADGGWAIALTPDGGDHDSLVAGLRPNANAWFDIASIDGYDGGVQVSDRWAAAHRRFTSDPPADLPLRNSLSAPLPAGQLGRLGVRWVLLASDREPSEWVPDFRGPIAADDRFTLWENPRWLGDAVVWSMWTTVEDDPADVLRDRFALLGSTALLEPVAGIDDRAECAVECAPRRAVLERRSPEHLVVDVAVEAPSIVTVAAQALADWAVTVDGHSADVVTVDGLLLGVRVDEGDHMIEFRYRPWWWWPGVALSVVSTLGVVALVWSGRRRPVLTS